MLRPVRPNPTGGLVTIDYELIEGGQTAMAIVDERGSAMTIFSGLMVPGAYRLEYDTRGLSSGRYWVVLQTPTARLVEGLVVW